MMMSRPETRLAGHGRPVRNDAGDPPLSHEPTIELVARACGGDMPAMEALLQRCLPPLKRWAHGRLPPAARGRMDTGDLVQEAALHVLGARIEMQWSLAEIAHRYRMPTVDAARMAVNRAVKRLSLDFAALRVSVLRVRSCLQER
jgi:hypothetical protein